MFRYLQKIALNPFFQALVVAVTVILFAPLGIEKYRCEQVELITSFDGTQFIYADLDHDGVSERVHTFCNNSQNAGIALGKGLYNQDQFNFKGVYEELSPRLMIGDYDGNGLDEIFIFTLHADSLLLHILQYGDTPGLILENRLMAIVGKNLQDPDFKLFPGEITDMNGDGYGDLVFAVCAGHSRQPRSVTIYDILNDTLHTSPLLGANISNFLMTNLDQDPYPEFVLNTYASGNYKDDPVPYSDTSSWLIVLDHDLGFLFPPLEFPGRTGGLQATLIQTSGGAKRILCCAGYGSPRPNTLEIFLADLQGNVIRQRLSDFNNAFASIGLLLSVPGFTEDHALYGIEKEGFYEIDSMLEIRRISEVTFSRRHPDFLDIDLDGMQEIILLVPGHQKHLVCRRDFSHAVELDMPMQPEPLLLSVKLNGDAPPQLSAQGDQVWKLFDYKVNLAYRLRILVWLGIYLAVLSFILGIRKLYGIQLKRRYETEKQMTRLQLSGIKAQMEPHFIMNTINMIGSTIYRQKPEEAYRHLLNFSGMVRSLLLSADRLTRTLEEELAFVSNYLELEKSRFPGLFDFSVKVPEDIDPEKVIVPKMIIQIHAENALKHGLMPKMEGGRLEISLKEAGGYLEILLLDNGIGRHAAGRKPSGSTGKGMKIIGQLFETYNKHNRLPLRQEIEDLHDERGQPAGTRVRIFVPLAFNPEIY